MATTRIWGAGSGGTPDGNWNTAVNWTGDTVPSGTDIAQFDSTATTNCSLNVAVACGGFNITSGYTGTITQTNTVQIGTTGGTSSSGWAQDGGTFTGDTHTFTIYCGSFALSGNTIFTSTSGTFQIIYATNTGTPTFTWTNTCTGPTYGFFHNNGYVLLQGGAVGATGSFTLNTGGTGTGKEFYDFNCNNYTGVTLASDIKINHNSTMASLNAVTYNVTIVGDWTVYSTGSAGVYSVYMGSGTWTVSGNIYVGTYGVAGGSVHGDTSTLVLSGTSKTITVYASNFYNVTLSGSYQITAGYGTLLIYNTFTMNTGSSFTVNNGAFGIYSTSSTFNLIMNGTAYFRASYYLDDDAIPTIAGWTTTANFLPYQSYFETVKTVTNIITIPNVATSMYGSQLNLFESGGTPGTTATFRFAAGTYTNLPPIYLNSRHDREAILDTLTNSPTISCSGLVIYSSGGYSTTKATWDISSGVGNITVNGDITVECANGSGSAFARIYVANGSPSLSFNGNLYFRSDLGSANKVYWDASTATTGTPSLTCNNIYLYGNSNTSGAVCSFDCGNGNPTITTQTLSFNGTGSRHETINANGTWNISSNSSHSVALGGGTFTANSSTFVFAGTGKLTVSSGVTWYNLTFGASKEHDFQSGLLQTVSHALASNGTHANPSVLRSTSSGLTWKLSAPVGTQLGNVMDIKDCDASTYALVKAWGSIGGSQNNTNISFGPSGSFSSPLFISGAI